MNSSIYLYHLFDVADEINLDLVEALWSSRNKIASRLRLERISADSITLKNPPILVELGSHEMTFAGNTYLAEVKARIFDIGVIGLIISLELPEDITYEQYLELAIALDNFPSSELREGHLAAVLETIEPACTNLRVSDFDEDFVVYYFRDPLPDWDFVPILLKDTTPVSAETRAETLSNRFSYAQDITYLTWDSALLYDNSGSMDIPYLLEFANAQFLELRYYDNALNEAIDHTYDELEEIEKDNTKNRQAIYRKVRSSLTEIMADVSGLTSNIDNALQVTEDTFYARVYSRYMLLLRTSVWRTNIQNKIGVIQRSYTLLNEEVNMHHFMQLGRLCSGLLIVICCLLLYLALVK